MEESDLRTDEELVRLTLGDKGHFGYLVDRYEAKLRSYIFRLGKLSVEDTDDLLQDIFVKVYQNLNAVDQSLKFSSWIYRIAHNETMSFFRKRSIRVHGHAIQIDGEHLASLAADTDVLNEVQMANDAESLKRALASLPPQYYEVIVLKFFEHKSYDEISDILSIPTGTVATRINRAKERLRTTMKSNGYE